MVMYAVMRDIMRCSCMVDLEVVPWLEIDRKLKRVI